MTPCPTQPVDVSFDIEALLRDTHSALAVAAFVRRIDLVPHIDNRLPVRALGDSAAVAAFLRRGLARMIEAGRAEKIVLAFWLEPGEGGAGPRMVLEAGRATGAGDAHALALADLWRLPMGEGAARPRPHRRDAAAESVLVPLPCVPDPKAPPAAETWRPYFAGRYILHVRDIVFDPDRFRASVQAVGFEAEYTTDPDAALALACERAESGKPVDFVVIDAHLLGIAAVELARRIRAEPRLADVAIVLAGSHRVPALGAEDATLFDARPSVSMPWRRLYDVLRELARARGGPQTRSEAAVPRPEPAGRAAGVPSLAGRRVLIAEDVATNQMLLRALLEPTGAEIEAVPTGDAVVGRHAAAPADLVIMDLQLPRMGGSAAAERIRALAGAAGGVPILALTAHVGDSDRERALAAGMDAFMAKPVVVSDFYDLVERLLAGTPDAPGGPGRH